MAAVTPPDEMKARHWQRSAAVAVSVLLAGLMVSACKEVETETETGYVPAQLEPVKGRDDLRRVTFTAQAAKRVGLRLAAVRRSGTHTQVPYAALVYDPEGKTYVYKSLSPLTFVREEVEVDRIEGDRALLSDGASLGSRVVSIGAAEVYGTELEVASH
jgi:hypothetical protein